MLISKHNQAALFNNLLPNSIAILPSADLKYRSRTVEYPFRQDSDFYYLTGFPEPKAVAVFIKSSDNNNQANKFILFSQTQDLHSKIWDGDRIGQQAAIDLFAADQAYCIDDFDLILPKLLLNQEAVYYPMISDQNKLSIWQATILSKLDQIVNNNQLTKFKVIENLLDLIAELRVIKSAAELQYITKAAEVSANAHNHIVKYIATNNNLTEKKVQAEFYNYCLQQGCDDMAYNPIVASGKNACILHYTQNNSQLKPGELVLIDAGAEYQYYAADISRTLPVNGKFSAAQKDLYQLVLLAQQAAVSIIKPGIIWSDLQQLIIKILVQGMIDLKILSGSVDSLIETMAYKDFYMHGSGHFLGMDVHDSGAYSIAGKSRELLPGMVFTVEPGLYFASDAKVDPKWQGIGIRIEDNILVTKNSYEVLTKAAIKEIADLEQIMSN